MVRRPVSRRKFLEAGAGFAVVAGAGLLGAGAAAADTVQPAGLSAVTARFAGRRPTEWGMYLPGQTVVGFAPRGREVALTFDACGGPGGGALDAELLNVLIRERVPATLFLNSRWIDANPAVTRAIIAAPQFEIGNHGTRHAPLSVTGRSAYGIPGTRSVAEVVDEVWANHEKLTELTGIPPRWFRTGTAHYDDIAAAVVGDLGEQPVAFGINGDAGATGSVSYIRTQLAAAQPGDICIGHMNQPGSHSAQGFAAAIADLRARGFTFVTLADRDLVTAAPHHPMA